MAIPKAVQVFIISATCLAHYAQEIAGRSEHDGENEEHAIASFLLAMNPFLSYIASGTESRVRTTGSLMQYAFQERFAYPNGGNVRAPRRGYVGPNPNGPQFQQGPVRQAYVQPTYGAGAATSHRGPHWGSDAQSSQRGYYNAGYNRGNTYGPYGRGRSAESRFPGPNRQGYVRPESSNAQVFRQAYGTPIGANRHVNQDMYHSRHPHWAHDDSSYPGAELYAGNTFTSRQGGYAHANSGLDQGRSPHGNPNYQGANLYRGSTRQAGYFNSGSAPANSNNRGAAQLYRGSAPQGGYLNSGVNQGRAPSWANSNSNSRGSDLYSGNTQAYRGESVNSGFSDPSKRGYAGLAPTSENARIFRQGYSTSNGADIYAHQEGVGRYSESYRSTAYANQGGVARGYGNSYAPNRYTYQAGAGRGYGNSYAPSIPNQQGGGASREPNWASAPYVGRTRVYEGGGGNGNANRLARNSQAPPKLNARSLQAPPKEHARENYYWEHEGDPRTFGDPSAIIVGGGSLKTWSYTSPDVERVQVVLTTEGTALNADVELWAGPENTSCRMRVHAEDGSVYPFNAIIEMPGGAPNTIGIRNTGAVELPFAAYAIANDVDMPLPGIPPANASTLQAGALTTYPSESNVQSVGVLLKTDGHPLNATIELHQGPQNSKQVVELQTNHGLDNPLFVIIATPWTIGSAYDVRVLNTGSEGFPMNVSIFPHYADDRSFVSGASADDSRGAGAEDSEREKAGVA